MELEQDVIEAPEVEEAENADEGLQQDEQGAEEQQADEGLVIDFGQPEEEAQGAPEWVKELRKANREKDKELRELRAKLAGQQPASEELPPEPTLEGCDYDEARFKAEWREWNAKNLEHEARQAEAKRQQEEIEQRWQRKVARYDEGKATLGAPDYDDAEATVSEILAKPFIGVDAPDVRLNVIKNVAADPNAVVYALGKNEAKAKELAEIDDVTAFAYAIGKLEAKMTIVRGGAKPAPERKISSTVPGVAGATDNTLERLREEAAKTGDFSKVHAYKRQQRA